MEINKSGTTSVSFLFGIFLLLHTKRFDEQVAATCPRNSYWFEFVGLFTGTSVRLDFEGKIASSHNGMYADL